MLAFWRNAEFVRHARAELRPVRLATAGALAVIVPLLIGTAVYGDRRAYDQEFWNTLFKVLLGIQTAVLTLWATLAGMQSIASERQQRTYDFVRTTRLTAAELLVGRVFGVAALGWVQLILTMVIAIPAALLGGVEAWRVVVVYVVLVSLVILFTLASLAVSAAMEKPNPGVGMLLLFLLWIFSSMITLVGVSFPGIAALSPIAAMQSALGVLERARFRPGFEYGDPTIFGHSVPTVTCTLLLYWTLSAWLVAILLRILKSDVDDARPFSQRMAVGFVIYVNAIMLAFYKPAALFGWAVGMPRASTANELVTVMVALNLFLLYFVGIATVEPAERLRVWWRKHTTNVLQEMQWPWIAAAAVGAFVLLVAELLPMRSTAGFENPPLATAALNLAVALAFAVRDTMFVQWCRLTRMKSATAKAVAYLGLYYVSVGIVIANATRARSDAQYIAGNLLTPFRLFNPEMDSVLWSAYAGIAIQIVAAFLLWRAIRGRLEHQTKLIVEAGPVGTMAG